jgi:hypothetical protein
LEVYETAEYPEEVVLAQIESWRRYMDSHINSAGVSWCLSHKRYEPAADYIDFECSPLFLGAFYEMGLTTRRPFAIPESQTVQEEQGYYAPDQKDVTSIDTVWGAVQRLQEQIKDIRNMLADEKVSGRRRGREQREIEL